jgi:hypothetical protein
MPNCEGFRAGEYAVGVDYASAGSTDESVFSLVKFGEQGEPDEVRAVLTWEEAKLIARAVTELETK